MIWKTNHDSIKQLNIINSSTLSQICLLILSDTIWLFLCLKWWFSPKDYFLARKKRNLACKWILVANFQWSLAMISGRQFILDLSIFAHGNGCYFTGFWTTIVKAQNHSITINRASFWKSKGSLNIEKLRNLFLYKWVQRKEAFASELLESFEEHFRECSVRICIICRDVRECVFSRNCFLQECWQY